MKNFIKTVGIIALLAVIGFSMAGCGGGDGAGSNPTPTVTKVTVSAANGATTVNKGASGNTLQFSAVVSGSNSPPQGVTWSITTPGINAGTTISQSGLLTVAGDETAPKLSIKATSTFNTNQSGYATVDVNDSSKSTLSGNIFITVSGDAVTTATTGTELTASYSGTESGTFTYQWYIDGYNVGPNSNKYTPYEAGNYTVTIGAAGYNNKTSAAVTVTGSSSTTPEDRPVAGRWDKWVADDATATLEYSVDSDGVCAITIGGTAQSNDESDGWGRWKANANYHYTATKDVPYAYTFEAWTDSGTRDLGFLYYNNYDVDGITLGTDLTITATQTSYTIKGQRIPNGGVRTLEFQSADKLGTFYVKMISIEPYTPELEYELIDEYDEWGSYNENHGTYRVISATGMGGAVNIPAEYNGKAVTEIGAGAFYNNKTITGVTIPTSVKVIGGGAFYECASLTTVTFASGSQLEYIEGWAFAECSSLTSITIPASVTYISADSVFAGCGKLTSIAVANGNQNFSSQGGILYNNDKTTLIAVPGGIKGSVTIPQSVEWIGDSAFEGCRGVTSITIPSSVQKIDWEAFRNCTGITSITIPTTVQHIGGKAFDGWTASQTIYIAGHDNRQSTINAGWHYSWDIDCNANIVYQAKHLVIKGISPELMAEFPNSNGVIGLFPAGTTVHQALQAVENYYQTGNAGSIVAGSEFSTAYTNNAFTIAYIPLFDAAAGNPWKGSGSYMIFMGVESTIYPYSQRAYWTGPVNFSSANTTITFNPAWEVNLP